MNVLLLEDRGSASFYVTEWLKKEGHIVFEAFNSNDAQSFWINRDQVKIHCIILDLNIPTDGLTEQQKNRSEGGLLSGWVWLQESVLSKEPKMRQRTIIYSDYITTLKEKVPEEDYRSIRMIPKRQRSSSATDVIACIGEIAHIK